MTMKLRNRLIALVCLFLFLALGAFLLLTSSTRKPFAIILFVGDNITSPVLGATRIFNGGAEARLQMEELPYSALSRNAANDFSIPDTASASTQISAGRRVNKGSLCNDTAGLKLSSLLELASLKGRATGLITTGEITGTTAASYYAKTLSGENRSDLALQFCSHPPFDFVAGGGSLDFESPEATSTNLPPSVDMNSSSQVVAGSPLKKMKDHGVSVLHSVAELEKQPFWKKNPLLALLSPGPLSPLSATGSTEGDPSAPSLSDLVRIAIRNLQSNGQGYLLVVDDPMIGQAARSNDAETMFQRILAFDKAISTARRYAGEKALVVVTGRETLGGLQLSGYPFLRDKGVAVLAINNQGYPSLNWSTGPGFDPDKGADLSHSKKTFATNSSVGILLQPSATKLPSGLGVGGDVLTLGVGPGSENLHGFQDLTQVHRLILNEL